MAGRPKYKMSVEQRAKQFMPFAALRGLPEALSAKEKIAADRVELSEEMAAELDRKLHRLQKGDMAEVVYYAGGEYLRKTGIVAGLDETAKILQIVSTEIAFADILDVNIMD